MHRSRPTTPIRLSRLIRPLLQMFDPPLLMRMRMRDVSYIPITSRAKGLSLHRCTCDKQTAKWPPRSTTCRHPRCKRSCSSSGKCTRTCSSQNMATTWFSRLTGTRRRQAFLPNREVRATTALGCMTSTTWPTVRATLTNNNINNINNISNSRRTRSTPRTAAGCRTHTHMHRPLGQRTTADSKVSG
jgi:hypothetical protein